MRKLHFLAGFLCFSLFATPSLARNETKLIKSERGSDSYEAGLATAWKKLSDGKYEFTIDTNAEVSKGSKLTAEMVKETIESKLQRKYEAKVAIKSPTVIEVSFAGPEDDFLKKLSRTRISGGKGVTLAAASTVSDGGIRAKIAARGPKDQEVKAKIIRVQGKTIQAFIYEVGKAGVPSDIKANTKIKLSTSEDVKQFGKGATVFFKPVSKDAKGIWLAKDFTQK